MKNTHTCLHPTAHHRKPLLFLFACCLVLFARSQDLRIEPAFTGKYQLVRVSTGRPVSTQVYTEINAEPNGFFRLYDGGHWGFANQQGVLLAGGLTFTQARSFCFQRAMVQQHEKWGCIDENGQQLIPFEYDFIADFQAPVTAARINQQWFLLNRSGAKVTAIDIDYFWGFHNQAAKVTRGGYSRYIDTAGQFLPGNWMPEPATTAVLPTHRTDSLSYVCPDNIDFEAGNFSNWACYTGVVDSSNTIPTTNVITVNPSAPINNRHTIVPRRNPSLLDPFGLFPINPPDGSNYCIRLGNNINGSQSERIRYVIHVPPTATDYSIVYQYAVVFQDPGHPTYAQPRFTAKLIDSATNAFLPCASFEYVADSTLPGFTLSTVSNDVWFKPWSAVFMNLSGYIGRTVYLEFTTADCTRGAHWGYAYVDVNQCDGLIRVQNTCRTPTATVLSGPPGFQTYQWWNADYSVLIGTGQPLTITPAITLNSNIHLELIPFSGFGCRDTLHGNVNFATPRAQAGPDKLICTADSIKIGSSPLAGYQYSWSPNYYISSTQVAAPFVNPPIDTSYYLTVTDTLTGCTARDTVHVQVNRVDTTINLSGPTQFCAGGSVLLQAGNASSYQWLFNHNPISGATAATYTATQAGNYSLAVQSGAACRDTSRSIQVQVFPIPHAGFYSNNNQQCLSGNQFQFTDTSFIVSGNLQHQWSFGDGNGSVATNPTYSYNQPGTDTVRLIVISNQGCRDTVKQVVTILPDPTVSISTNGQASFCAGGSVLLQANASTAVGSITQYQWYLGGNPIAGATNASLVASVAGNYQVSVITSNQCVKQSGIRTVTVLPNPVANFNSLPATQCLASNQISFQNLSTPNGGTLTHQWNFGDNSSATLANPVHHYANSGNYPVQLTVTNSAGCQHTITDTVHILPNPIVTINSNPVSFCLGDSATLTVQAAVPGSSSITYQWFAGSNPIAGATLNSLTVHLAGNYWVQATSSNTCGTASLQVPVTVSPLPTGQILAIPGTTVCEGTTGYLVAPAGLAYQWFENGTALPGATHDSLAVTQAGHYSVLLTNAAGCRRMADDTIAITLIRKPRPAFHYVSVCRNLPLTFTNLSDTSGTYGVAWEWHFGDGLSSAEYQPTHTFPGSGNYAVTLSMHALACATAIATQQALVHIDEPEQGIRYPDVDAIKLRPTPLHARDIGVQYSWQPSAGLNNNALKDPVFTSDRPEEYYIHITTRSGCTLTDTVLVRLFDRCDIHVPNAFSPNDDGKNDTFFPFLIDVADYRTFRVYDRWGQLMFVTDEPGKGWNGIYHGRPAPMDTYTWLVEGICADGRVIKKSGNVLLLR
jgi:gliding motility-associated-like protein